MNGDAATRETNRRPTLEDVARLAGVSAKTVSNVMLDRPNVSAATRATVRAAADTVGYRPNHAGRGLASGRTGRIAVVVPNLFQPYFAEMAERLILALEDEGLTTTLRIAGDVHAELAAVIGSSTRDADGVVICPAHFRAAALGGRALDRPVVQVGGPATDSLDCVIMGEYAGANAVTRHLLDTGRRRLAIIWNGLSTESGRYAGVVDALAERGIDPDPALFAVGSDWDRRESGYEAMVGLLRTGVEFDAAVCANDATAVGVVRALRSHGRRVPEDVAVTGFDNTDESEFASPPLTSVSPDPEGMASAAVRMLVDRLDGYDGPARSVRTGAELMIRRSSGPAS
ncbi:LacI family DNA-binding transcriptional regulator [Promicromonospora thailandica]